MRTLLLIALVVLVGVGGCKKVKQCNDEERTNARITHHPCSKDWAEAIAIVYLEDSTGTYSFGGEMPLKKIPKKFRPKPNETIEVIIGWGPLYPFCLTDTDPCSPCENIAIHCIEG